MRTTTEWPLLRLSTRTWVPKGSVRWAAARMFASIASPLAVLLPILYQEALPHWAADATPELRVAAAQNAPKANPNARTRDLLKVTRLHVPFVYLHRSIVT